MSKPEEGKVLGNGSSKSWRCKNEWNAGPEIYRPSGIETKGLFNFKVEKKEFEYRGNLRTKTC